MYFIYAEIMDLMWGGRSLGDCVKATLMGCVCEMYFRLTNFSFYLIWARMNHFKARLMVLPQKVDSKVLKMAI